MERREANETLDAKLDEERAEINRLGRETNATISKEEFFAHLCNEIKTPINAVLGMNMLLLETELTPVQRSYADIIRSSADSLLALFNDALDFTKAEAGTLTLEEVSLNPHAMVYDFVSTWVFRMREKGLKFDCTLSPDVPDRVQCDPGRLRQVLNNLVENACNFTEKGSVSIGAQLTDETDTEVVLRFYVRDTGIGISKEYQNYLFRKYTPPNHSIAPKYGSTGLGLFICKKLVELMGGQIGLKSQLGSGSTFWFTVRLTKDTATPRPVPTADITGLRVLIVDENDSNRRELIAHFADWDVLYEQTPSLDLALQMLRTARSQNAPFDVVILGTNIVGATTEVFGQSLRGDPLVKDTALVLLASVGNRGDAAKLRKDGFSAYLIRPFLTDDLYDCLAQMSTLRPYLKINVNLHSPLVTRHTLEDDRRGRARILLVEDNSVNQMIALGILRKLGYSADTASTGKDALRALERTRYDLVLMDCEIPELDGYQTTKELRGTSSLAINRALPVLALTTNSTADQREKAIGAGMDDFLTKPLDPERLATSLRFWLSQRTGMRTERALVHAPDQPAVSLQTPSAHAGPVGTNERGQDIQQVLPNDMSSLDVFREADFLKPLSADRDLARRILKTFLDDTTVRIAELNRALDQHDHENARRQAHTIKDAAENIRANALSETAAQFERAIKAGSDQQSARLASRIQKEFSRLKSTLRQKEWLYSQVPLV